MNERGIFYIGLGDGIFDYMGKSIRSLRAHMPNIPIALVTNCDMSNNGLRGEFSRIIQVPRNIDHPHFGKLPAYPDQGLSGKVFYMGLSPFEHTLFLDHDTYICGDLSPVFELLDHGFEIAACPENFPHNTTHSKCPPTTILYNTGVIAFRRCPKTNEFLEYWKNTLIENKEIYGDQDYFVRSVYNTKILIAPMPQEYNMRFIFPQRVTQFVRILHGRHDNIEGIAKRINEHQHRLKLWFLDRQVGYYDAPNGRFATE